MTNDRYGAFMFSGLLLFAHWSLFISRFAFEKVTQGFVGDGIEEHDGGDENDKRDDGFHKLIF